MVYLPKRVWDMRSVGDGGGWFLLFADEHERWHELRIYQDGRRPLLVSHETPPDLDCYAYLLPNAAVEVPAQNFRVNWLEDGRIGVVGIQP